MAIDITTIGVGVDTAKLKAGSRELDNFGKSADNASRKADGLTGNTQKLGKETGVATAALGRMLPALAAVASVGSIVRTLDEYTKFNAQLKLATRSQQEYTTALADVNRIANTAQVSLSSIGTLYARLNNALRDVGVSQTQVGKIAETVGLALKVSGATATESASAMLQLSQAFGSGVLRGEEFNAVNEAAPALMRALAESIGVPIGKLRDLASDGQITSEVLAKAFGDDKLLESFRAQAKEIGTIGGALQIVKNELTSLIAMVDKGTGLSSWVKDTFGNLAEYLRAIQLVLNDGTFFEKLRFFTIGNLSERLTTKLRSPAGSMPGSAIPGSRAITGNGSIAPSFGVPRAVDDINEVHRQQEEALRIQKDANKKYQDDRKKVQDAITATRLSAIEHEYTVEANSMENMLDKKAFVIKEEQKLKEAAYKDDLKRIDALQDAANANYKEAQKSFKDAEEEKLREFEKTVDGINQVFREGFANLVNGGKGSWKAFAQSLFTTFKTTVADAIYKLFAQPFVVKLVASILGLGGSGAALAGDGSSGGIGGIFSSIKDGLSSLNSNVVGSIESLGTFLSTGNGGLGDTIGGFLGQNASAISSALAYSGAALALLKGDLMGAAFQGAGAAIGNFILPGVGGVIGAALGGVVGGLFGGKSLPPRLTESRSATSSGGVTSFFNGTDPGKRKLGAASTLDGLNAAFINNLNTLFGAYGVNDDISSNSLLTKKKNTRSRFSASVNGQFLGYDEFNLGKKGSFQDAFNQMMEAALGSYTVKAIQASSLPEGIKKFFDGLTKKEDVAETINTLIGLKTTLMDLPAVFNAVRNAIDTTAYTTSLEALKAQFSATQTFVGLFYTESEKFGIFSGQLSTQLEALNKVLPTSRDEYRAWVDGINVVDEASRDQFNGLIALAPAMDEYFKQLQQQADGINEVNKALADGLDKNLYSTYANYASAQATTAAGMNESTFVGERSFTNQINTELVAAVKSLQAQQASTERILIEIADSTRKSKDINERWNGDGLPETRVY